MIRPPKALTIGANAKEGFEILYVGSEVLAGIEAYEKPPKGIRQIFFFRNGSLVRSRETEEARIIGAAKLKAAEEASRAAVEKAAKEREAKAKAESEAKASASKKIQADNAAHQKASAEAAAQREVDVLKHAASEAEKAVSSKKHK